MKVTLKQSSHGWIWISIECSHGCTQILTSCVFDPYKELYIWLGQIRDSQLPTTMFIDHEGPGVELVAEQSSDDLIRFRVEPWMCGNDITTRLNTQLKRHELLKAFHDGIVEFIKHEYCPSDWSYIDDLSNTNWGALLKLPNIPSHNWQKRLAMYGGGHGRVPKTGLETVWKQLTQEQQMLVILQDTLIEIATLSAKGQTTQAQVLADMYKRLPIDIALGEVDLSWYQERRAALETEYGLGKQSRDDRNRRRTQAKARLETLKLGQIVDGTVRRVKPYGAFVDIGGYYALLHISTISQLTVEHPEQVFKCNDWVRAMVVWMDVEKGRVLLSTSDLEPESGDMLKQPLKVYEKAEEMAARYCQHVLS
ncbi:MAG TPA: RNA-binding protein [Cyanobacteria bacterium UBA11049]|nr:RNA-binding protein [Cyanobacteria bacterium UBA11049]